MWWYLCRFCLGLAVDEKRLWHAIPAKAFVKSLVVGFRVLESRRACTKVAGWMFHLGSVYCLFRVQGDTCKRKGGQECNPRLQARLQIRLVAISEKVLTHPLAANAKYISRGLWTKILLKV